MTRTVSGRLDTTALARLHFSALDAEGKAAAIAQMALTQTDSTIAQATGLSVEMVRRILSDRPPPNQHSLEP
jgi:hypothetical protein